MLDDVDVKQIQGFESGFHQYMGTTGKQILDDIMTKKSLDDDIKKRLTDAINDYKKSFVDASRDSAADKQPAMATA